MVKPTDYTKQENIIAECLSTFGMRYDQQYDFYPYTVDFFIADIRMVIEADGVYGHLRKRDVIIIGTTKQEIEEELWQGLNKL